MKDYYRAQVDVNLDAIYGNILRTREIIKPETRIMAIIKADGYGHGAVAVYKVLDEIVDAYGVAIPEEAIELRKAGASKTILILGVSSPMQYEIIVKNDISQTVINYDMAKKLSDIAAGLNKTALIHIKLDTGMTRIGFKDNEESVQIIKKISELPNVCIEGLFTHFACADCTDKEHTYGQLDRYNKFRKRLEDVGVKAKINHVSNSAGIMEFPEANMDMVRSGISTYGLYPSEEVDKSKLLLEPAMSIKTIITYIKEVEEGVGISYGSTYVTPKKSRIATIPVGYADGYPRQLSSKGRVLIKGHSVPIVGRICMDQFMVDVTGFDDIEAGDEVVLIGKDKDEIISVEELSGMAGSFNYEFVCDIGKRLPRVYYRNNKKVGTFDFYECTEYALKLEM